MNPACAGRSGLEAIELLGGSGEFSKNGKEDGNHNII